MKGLSNAVIALLLLLVVVPASALLVSKVREYADIARNQAGLNQPVTLVAYLLENNNQDLLIVCNYGLRTIGGIYAIDGSGNHTQVVSTLEPKTCYIASLPVRIWHSVTAGGQVISILRVS